jgi:hypothetical protein
MHYLFVAMMATMGVILAPFVIFGAIQAIRTLAPIIAIVIVCILLATSHIFWFLVLTIGPLTLILYLLGKWVNSPQRLINDAKRHKKILEDYERFRAARLRKEIKKNPWWGLTDDEISRYK